MSKLDYAWPADTFDGISIRTGDGRFTVQGIDDTDEVRLEAECDEKHLRSFSVNLAENWLQVKMPVHSRKLNLYLWLPVNKVWLLALFNGHADFQACGVRAYIDLMLGSGDVQIEKCRGAVSVTSGSSSVRIQQFAGEKVPEMPVLPEEEKPPKPPGPGKDIDMTFEFVAQWGHDLSEKVLRNIFGHPGKSEAIPGINVKLGKGSLHMEQVNTDACIVRSGSIDVGIKGGRASNLDINTMKGSIDCTGMMPSGDWVIKTNYGNISLYLPANAAARLDVATRSGEVQSHLPLVRVARQGSGGWHGGRMVGTVGAPLKQEKLTEINLSTLRGDIKLDMQAAGRKVSTPHKTAETEEIFDTPLAVLQALRDGRITVDEAERLLSDLGP